MYLPLSSSAKNKTHTLNIACHVGWTFLTIMPACYVGRTSEARIFAIGFLGKSFGFSYKCNVKFGKHFGYWFFFLAIKVLLTFQISVFANKIRWKFQCKCGTLVFPDGSSSSAQNSTQRTGRKRRNTPLPLPGFKVVEILFIVDASFMRPWVAFFLFPFLSFFLPFFSSFHCLFKGTVKPR